MIDLSFGLSRRSFLRVGALTALGLSLPSYLRLRTAAAGEKSSGRAVRCILLWMEGGPSHLDTFDPKPEAPAEVRGEFGTTATTLLGVRVSDLLPLVARQTSRFSIIRGHEPQNSTHGMADHLMMSGHKFDTTLPFPCYGSVVSKERGYPEGMLPFVQLGRHIERRFSGGTAGFLGDQLNPFEVPEDPNRADFRVRNLVAEGPARQRLARRSSLLADLDRRQQAIDRSAAVVQARDAFYDKAFSLVTSPQARRAFDLSQETEQTRAGYGRTTLGQSCLLARRLIEAGTHFVTVTDGGWDTHAGNFRTLRDKLPVLDRALAALVQDLHERGLLETTLVVWMGDFGRTPKINAQAGRDHWASAGVVCMGGGGVRGGEVVGATSPLGEQVLENPIAPEDIAATIYHALGVPLHTWYKTADGRPIELIPTGKPVRQLVG